MTDIQTTKQPNGSFYKQPRILMTEERQRLALYVVGTNYAPFTAKHAITIMDVSSYYAALEAIKKLIALGYATTTSPPEGLRGDAPSRNDGWYRLTKEGISTIITKARLVNLPRRGSLTPLYADELVRIEVANPVLTTSTQEMVVQRPVTSGITLAVPSGKLTIELQDVRSVYDQLAAMYGGK